MTRIDRRRKREMAVEMNREYTEAEREHVIADACTAWLLSHLTKSDILVMANVYGDIISDEASTVAASLGMGPSAQPAGLPRAGERIFGFYESALGSAPRHAGKNDANSIAPILSAALKLRYTFGLGK
ncbi:MAG: hypothetical protein JW846_09750 [Dehalococcoidia bacterium]|nr:hypothetical protein [Dehalococcoidia bacterium]